MIRASTPFLIQDHCRQAGVTLIELVMIIVVLGVISVPFSSAILQTPKTLIHSNEIISSNGLARECAEFILQQRRTGVITTSPALTVCDDPVIPGFNAPQETVSLVSDLAGAGNCPVGSGGCDRVTVTINNTAVANTRANLYIYLVY